MPFSIKCIRKPCIVVIKKKGKIRDVSLLTANKLLTLNVSLKNAC